MAKYLPVERVSELLSRLSADARVVAPRREGETVLFATWDGSWEPELREVRTVNSIKDFLFPQREVLFRVEDGRPVETLPDEKTVLFGIRPCDLGSLAPMDRVLSEGAFPDPYWEARRRKTTIIGLGCAEPRSSCFCTAFGLGPATAAGSDLFLYPAADRLWAEALTARGEEILRDEAFLEGADAELLSARDALASQVLPLAENLLTTDLPAQMNSLFASPLWEELSARCLACGICTYSCPTCHCFLITDESTPEGIVRVRGWDSCQFPSFTRVAGGGNPRPEKSQRFRQRFLHKLAYFPERQDRYLCVGCGRCVDLCPVGLDMVTVITSAREVLERG